MMDIIELSFIEEMMEMPLLPRFRLPQTGVYNGQWGTADHLELYGSWMELKGASKAIMFKAFSLTLTGLARQWF